MAKAKGRTARKRRIPNVTKAAEPERKQVSPKLDPRAFLARVERLDARIKPISPEEIQAFKIACRP
jgi:hypothetical protein